MSSLNKLPSRFILFLTLWLILRIDQIDLSAQDLPPAYAITNITIHQAGQESLPSATIVWRDGVITDVGQNISIPFDAFTINAGDSLHLYPGFIDALNVWGSPDDKWEDEPGSTPGSPSYERAGIAPQKKLSNLLIRSKEGEEALKRGFTVGNLTPKGRMLPGSSELFLIDAEIQNSTLLSETGLVFRFQSSGGGWTSRAYPSTDMAVIAKFRQLLYDAKALHEHIQFSESRNGGSLPVVERDPVLMSLIPVINGEKKLFFELANAEDLDRLFTLQDEFGFQITLITGQDITDWSEELIRREIAVLSTLRVPKKPDWMKEDEKDQSEAQSDSSEESSESIPQWKIEEERLFNARQKQVWSQEVKALSILKGSGVEIGFSGIGVSSKDAQSYIKLLLEEGGFSEDDLLRMMTTNNAKILGLGDRLGSLKKGSIASFSIFTDPFTAKDASVAMSVTNGHLVNWED